MLDGNEMGAAMKLAETLAKSGLVPRAVQGKPADVLVILLTGRELGLQPMLALRSIHVVEGKPTLSADLMQALCVSKRDVCAEFRQVESSAKRATYTAKRVGMEHPVTLTWTWEMAQVAGVTGKDNWKKYPDAMLRARCKAALARDVFPDLMAGLYDPDELGADVVPVPAEVPVERPALSPPASRETLETSPVQEKVPVQRERGAEEAKVEEPSDDVENEALAIVHECESVATPEGFAALVTRGRKIPEGTDARRRVAAALKRANQRLTGPKESAA